VYFVPGTVYIAPIGVKICMMVVEICPVHGLLRLVAISLGVSKWGRVNSGTFRQFIFDVASVNCVIYNVHSCVAVPFVSGHRLLRRLHGVVVGGGGSRAIS